jgi:hypothetical protein
MQARFCRDAGVRTIRQAAAPSLQAPANSHTASWCESNPSGEPILARRLEQKVIYSRDGPAQCDQFKRFAPYTQFPQAVARV